MFKHIHYDFPRLIKETVGSDRFYTTPDGKKYASVTTILAAHNKAGLDKWRKRIGIDKAAAITKNAATRGTSVHAAVEKLLRNEDTTKLGMMPHSKILYVRLKQELVQRVSEVHAIETPLVSHELRLAGTTDLVAHYDGLLSIVDFKTSLKPKKKEWVGGYYMQGVAYSHMFEEMTGKSIDQIVVLVAVDNCNYCQTFRLVKSEFGPWLDKLISYRDKYEDGQRGTLWAI